MVDVNMPNMDGFEMIRSLRQVESLASSQIVVVTGLSDQELLSRGGRPGDVPVYRKPLSLSALEDILEGLAGPVRRVVQPDGAGKVSRTSR